MIGFQYWSAEKSFNKSLAQLQHRNIIKCRQITVKKPIRIDRAERELLRQNIINRLKFSLLMKSTLLSSNKVKAVLHLLYFIFAGAYTMQRQIGLDWLIYVKIVPLIIAMILLLPEVRHWEVKLTILGLLFGALGDLILEHCGDSMFSAGAGAFLVGHILYSFAFLSLWRLKDQIKLLQRKYMALFICIILLSICSLNLSTSISDKLKKDEELIVYLIPVYLVFLSCTAINPILLLLGDKYLKKSSFLLVLGGLLFFVSDNVLGKSKFSDFAILDDTRYNSLVIMVSYYLGQYFITLGIRNSMPKIVGDEQKSLIESRID